MYLMSLFYQSVLYDKYTFTEAFVTTKKRNVAARISRYCKNSIELLVRSPTSSSITYSAVHLKSFLRPPKKGNMNITIAFDNKTNFMLLMPHKLR